MTPTSRLLRVCVSVPQTPQEWAAQFTASFPCSFDTKSLLNLRAVRDLVRDKSLEPALKTFEWMAGAQVRAAAQAQAAATEAEAQA